MTTDLFSLEVLPALAITAIVALYYAGARRMRQKGRPWTAKRSIPFYLGVASLAIATQTWIAAKDTEYFSAHVVQHLILSMVAPILIALGAPITLLLQSTDRKIQTRVLTVLNSRYAKFMTFPGTGWILFVATLFVLYFSGLYDLSLRNEMFHNAVHVHFFAAGYLFFSPVVAIDPHPWRMHHGLRLLYVGLTLPAHAFLALALMSNTKPISEQWYASVTGWSPERILFDQQIGAGIMWVSGDLIAIVTVAVVAMQWWKIEGRVATREDKLVAQITAQRDATSANKIETAP